MTPAGMPWRPGQRVSVSVPANLGPGFDCVGVGLELRDECEVAISATPGVRVTAAGEGAGSVPTDARHLVARSFLRACEVLGAPAPIGLELRCRNVVPHSRGLGSSATAIVTGVGAAYALWSVATTGRPDMDLDAVNDLAAAREGHPDNSSASVFGQMTLSWLADEQDAAARVQRTTTVRLTPHPLITPVVFVPEVQLSTATARAVLPSQVRLGDAAANSVRVGLLVHAMTAAPEMLVPATRDYLHQEPRRSSYAASMALVDELRAAGVAATISGAGPSVLALAVGDGAVVAAAKAPADWRVLTPGFASVGLRVEGSSA